MFNISHNTKRIPTDEQLSWSYLRASRAQAYLFKEFDDVNLKHDYIPLMGDELVEQILSFFYLGSQLIYPAKSYFVAIVYASIVSFYAYEDFWETLSFNDLLVDDKYFKPYGVDPQVDYVYREVTARLVECMTKKTKQFIYLSRPESNIWLHFSSCRATLEYFFDEFLFSDEDRECIKGQAYYSWESYDV